MPVSHVGSHESRPVPRHMSIYKIILLTIVALDRFDRFIEGKGFDAAISNRSQQRNHEEPGTGWRLGKEDRRKICIRNDRNIVLYIDVNAYMCVRTVCV